MLKEARLKYPNKAGKIERHHIAPKYLGGKSNSDIDNEKHTEYQDNATAKNWQVDIYRYTDGKHVFSRSTEEDQMSINTTRWDSGIYIIRIVVDGQLFTQKIRI